MTTVYNLYITVFIGALILVNCCLLLILFNHLQPNISVKRRLTLTLFAWSTHLHFLIILFATMALKLMFPNLKIILKYLSCMFIGLLLVSCSVLKSTEKKVNNFPIKTFNYHKRMTILL